MKGETVSDSSEFPPPTLNPGPHLEFSMRIQVLRSSVPRKPYCPSPATSPCLPNAGGTQCLAGPDLSKLGADPPGSGDLTQVLRAGRLTFPKASSTESKYRSIPKRMKKMPKPVVPTPISAMRKEVGVGRVWGASWDAAAALITPGQAPSGGGRRGGSVATRESGLPCSPGRMGRKGRWAQASV